MIIRFILFISSILVPEQILLAQGNESNGSQDRTKAEQAASSFIQKIDQGDFAGSWKEGSRLFRTAIPEKHWVMALELGRAPLGAVEKRQISEERSAANPPGLPEGSYMIILYDTSFAKAPEVQELVTLIKEGGTSWKVLTYQINLSQQNPFIQMNP